MGNSVAPPIKKYGVILADPPWIYQDKSRNGAAQKHYPTESDEFLYSMNVLNHASKNAVLVLWATWPKLVEAQRLCVEWGFNYVTGFPWVKLQEQPFIDLMGNHITGAPAYGTGYWVRGCTEPILIARRGQPRIPESGHLGLLSKRFEHSRKPDSIYEYCETMDGPYLELFARRKRPGWDAFGNEIESDVNIETRKATA